MIFIYYYCYLYFHLEAAFIDSVTVGETDQRHANGRFKKGHSLGHRWERPPNAFSEPISCLLDNYFYTVNQYPNRDDRAKLAEIVGMEKGQVKRYFENKRYPRIQSKTTIMEYNLYREATKAKTRSK